MEAEIIPYNMTEMAEKKVTVQRFIFEDETVSWTSYKIEKNDTSRSYAACDHVLFKKYFGQADTLVANLVNLTHLLDDGSHDKLFFTKLLHSYIID